MASSKSLIQQEEEFLIDQQTLLSKMFSWYHPTSEKKCAQAEQELLEEVGIPIKRRFVKIPQGYINTLEMGGHTQDESKAHLNKTLVIAPGFGAGAAMFYKNFKAFGTVEGLRVLAIDWLGTGRSSRIPFTFRPGSDQSVDDAEAFFVDSLEEWRKEEKIDKMILFGHSLGGYLSACYAMKHPERVEHLLLVSPAGVPVRPELTEEELKQQSKSAPVLFQVVRYFWEKSYTPQDFIRLLGPLGPNLIKLYTDRRFALEGEEARKLRDYAYHINVRKGSGEYAVHCILGVGAWARKPLMSRVENIQSPTTFLYGNYDWMNPSAGAHAAARMKVPTGHIVVPQAGHHLYLENPEYFNRKVLKVIRSIQRVGLE